MFVKEACVEVKDAVADDVEAKVAGLDDAGVDGADGDLVDALALDAEERMRRRAG